MIYETQYQNKERKAEEIIHWEKKKPQNTVFETKVRLHYTGLEDYLQKIKIYDIDYLDI